jgi:hypothetical protein
MPAEGSQDRSIEKCKMLLLELATILRSLSDTDVPRLLGDGTLDELLNAILDPRDVGKFPSIAEFFLANKQRSSLIAAIRSALTRSYSVKVTKGGVTGYVSPSESQWFEDGVMLLEGKQPFEGFLGLFRNGRLSHGIAARDIAEGEAIGPTDLQFVDIDQARKQLLNRPTTDQLASPLDDLTKLLAAGDPDESKYQQLFASHPWVLGLQYDAFQRHDALDDHNIPDFTGARVSDGCRDIFELKPPSMSVFRRDGEFSADFNAAWNQAERYLNFAREERDYLRRKGLRFNNPKCYLICGYDLPHQLLEKVRVKEKMNPAVQLMTFNDVLAFMRATIKFIQGMAADRRS